MMPNPVNGPLPATVASAFGNFQVTFTNGHRLVTVVRDRGQFHVVGERDSLERAQLWRSFTGAEALSAPLVEWLRVDTAAS